MSPEPTVTSSNGAGATPWLIMVYLAGDNNLTEEMVLSLQDLKAEGPPKDNVVVAQFDPSGSGLETQRYVFEPHSGSARTSGNAGSLEDHRDQTFDGYEVNTGSAEALTEFITWASRYGENRNWMLVLSGHGGGTSEDFLLKDENAFDALSIDELAIALRDARTKTGKTIDILGMDACFMSMGEVAHRIRDYAHILVGAEGLEPAFGWPYRRLLAGAKAQPAYLNPERLAGVIVREYVDHYADYDRTAGRSADLAAIDLRRLTPVVETFAALVTELNRLDAAGHNTLLLAHWYAQTYKFDQYVDLWDLCEQMMKLFPKGTGVPDRCHAVVKALGECIIAAGCSGFAYQHSHGLSIYFPWAYVSPDYLKLPFATQTGWDAFLRIHVAVTQREPRFDEDRDQRVEQSPAAERREGMIDVGQLRQRVAARQKRRLERLQGLLANCSGSPAHRGAEESEADRRTRRQLTALLRTRLVPEGDRDKKIAEVLREMSCSEVPQADEPLEITRRFVRRGHFGDHNSRYTGGASRYTGGASRYTGGASKYTGGASRSPADLEKSVKNFPPVIGKVLAERKPAQST